MPKPKTASEEEDVISFDDWEEIKRQVEADRREADMAIGSLRTIRDRLKSDFGPSSLKEAERLLDKEGEEERRMAVEFAAALKEFKADYAGKKE